MIAATLGLILLGTSVSDGTKADLNSPCYAVRQRAENQLRAAFVPKDCHRWDEITTRLQRLTGKPVADVVAAARSDGIPLAVVNDPSRPFSSRLILDDDWVIECAFEDGALRNVELFQEPSVLPIEPPPNYTGLWRFYRANGALAGNAFFSKGMRCGPLADGGPPVLLLPPVQSFQPFPPVPASYPTSYTIITTRLPK